MFNIRFEKNTIKFRFYKELNQKKTLISDVLFKFVKIILLHIFNMTAINGFHCNEQLLK